MFSHMLGLGALYARGWIHRDISVGNILIVDGQVKISDLEYAKMYMDMSLPHSIRTVRSLTVTDGVVESKLTYSRVLSTSCLLKSRVIDTCTGKTLCRRCLKPTMIGSTRTTRNLHVPRLRSLRALRLNSCRISHSVTTSFTTPSQSSGSPCISCCHAASSRRRKKQISVYTLDI